MFKLIIMQFGRIRPFLVYKLCKSSIEIYCYWPMFQSTLILSLVRNKADPAERHNWWIHAIKDGETTNGFAGWCSSAILLAWVGEMLLVDRHYMAVAYILFGDYHRNGICFLSFHSPITPPLCTEQTFTYCIHHAARVIPQTSSTRSNTRKA